MSNRRFRDLALFIVDIFVAVHKINEYTQPFANENNFRHNSLHWDATIRQLEVIGEALNNLLDDEEFSTLSPTYFRKVVNFRNAISHGYFGIDLDEVWNVTHQHLPVLINDLQTITREHNLNISEAIRASINEYTTLCDVTVVEYLENIFLNYEQNIQELEKKETK